MKRPRRRWTKTELQFLKDNINKISVDEIARHLNVKPVQVKRQYQFIGLLIQPHWTNEQTQLLKDNYAVMKMDDLVALIGKRANCIRQKASSMGLTGKRWSVDWHNKGRKIGQRFWTKERIGYLTENVNKLSIEEMALHIGKPEHIITGKLIAFGLIQKERHPKYWTEEEIHYLKDHYGKTKFPVIASHLKKSKRAIQDMASKFNLKVFRPPVPPPKRSAFKFKEPVRKEPKRNPRRWDNRKLPLKPFNADGKKLIRVDSKTAIYVPINATDEQVEKILSQYRKTA